MKYLDETPLLYMDSGLFMDDDSGPATKRNKMAKVVVGISGLTDLQVIARANELNAGMTGNVNITTPDPTVIAYGLLITNAEQLITTANTSAEKAKQDTAAKDAAIQAIIDASNLWGAQVQKESKGDPTIINSTNMGVKGPYTPVGPMPQVGNLSLSVGDNPGELDAQWDPVFGRQTYQVEWCVDPVSATGWKDITPTKKSQTTIPGLTSGTKVWVRVRAVGAEGAGPWSSEISKFVP